MARDDSSSKTPRRSTLSVDEYFRGVRAGEMPVVARALTLIESSNPEHQLQAEQLLTQPHAFHGRVDSRRHHRLAWRRQEHLHRGLGAAPDGRGTSGRRARHRSIQRQSRAAASWATKHGCQKLAAEPNAYIRPSPASGTLGGAARRTRESMLLCEAAGYDVVLVETVGVGQSESHVVHMTDCFLTLMLPLAGDELQGIKRGLLEVVDFIVVNKADGEMRTACEVAARQYRSAIESLSSRAYDETPQVLTCSALHERRRRRRLAQRRSATLATDNRRHTGRSPPAAESALAVGHRRWTAQAVDPHAPQDRGRFATTSNRRCWRETLSAEAAARSILEACGLL